MRVLWHSCKPERVTRNAVNLCVSVRVTYPAHAATAVELGGYRCERPGGVSLESLGSGSTFQDSGTVIPSASRGHDLPVFNVKLCCNGEAQPSYVAELSRDTPTSSRSPRAFEELPSVSSARRPGPSMYAFQICLDLKLESQDSLFVSWSSFLEFSRLSRIQRSSQARIAWWRIRRAAERRWRTSHLSYSDSGMVILLHQPYMRRHISCS